ncbi:MAG: glycerol kinase [Chloroflexi bacterium]|nr:glycerol kinase [Chloroflexota bacterium]MQG57247.1 glycerol kinase GlpK [SAR202 cluster bacterium]HAL48756.1 glycerol kinase [Dehalococcoidia bacterium]
MAPLDTIADSWLSICRGEQLPDKAYIMALDQGTTGTTAVLVDSAGHSVHSASREITQIFPKPGWVEHDPVELFESCLETAGLLLETASADSSAVAAIGITNQRETAVVWERDTGVPVMNAIVWQCRRTAPLCEELIARGLEGTVRAKTGLPIDAYFTGTKFRWILDHIPDGQQRAEAGDLLCGTVDSWLMWKLTGGAAHVTDVTNASRTMLFNIRTLDWDDDLLAELNIPRATLPEVRPSSAIYGHAVGEPFGDGGIPIAGVAGDQQAALFGQACFEPGMAKNTYGTGSFVLVNTGDRPMESSASLIATVAWKLGDEVTYALEGSIFSTGATVQWLRDGLGLIDEASQVEELAASVPDNGGVYLVPAFTGLGAPHWDMYARGAILGLTRDSGRGHLALAALESTAHQTADVLDAMKADTGLPVAQLRADGGATANELLMQLQADILGIQIERSAVQETTALGAAYLAGLGVGFWDSTEQIAALRTADAVFEPRITEDRRTSFRREWRRAVERSKSWVDEDETMRSEIHEDE